jgi:hypothetical protein
VRRRAWSWLSGPVLGAVLLALGPVLSAQTVGTPTTLEFGEAVVDPSGGSITLNPATGAITAASGVYTDSTLATTASATVATDKGGRTATVYTTASSVTLSSGSGGAFSVSTGPFSTEYTNDQFTFPGPPSTTSSVTFHVGGTLTIPAGQVAGDYNGTLPLFIRDNVGNDSSVVNVPIHIRLIAPIALSKTQDLDMGTVIPGATAGSVTLNATTGAQGITGGVVYASPAGQAAQFAVTGQPSHLFSVVLGSSPITLTGPGGTMSLALLASPSGSATFSAAGTAALNVGGTLTVGANQADGDYTGTFTLTVSYP